MAEEKDNIIENSGTEQTPEATDADLSTESSSKTKRGKKKGVKNTAETSAQYDYIIKDKKVRRKTQNRKRATIILILLALLILVGASIWAIFNYLEYNNFKIMIDREGRNVFSLSPHSNLDNKSEVIYIDGPNKMDNVTLMGQEQLILDLEKSEGSVLNKNMVTGTFYLTNVTDKDRSYLEQINIVSATRGIEKTIRILVINTHFDTDGNEIKGSRTVDCYAHIGNRSVEVQDKDGKPVLDDKGNKTFKSIEVPEAVVPVPSDRRPDRRLYDGFDILYPGKTRDESYNPTEWTTKPFASKDVVVEQQRQIVKVGEKVRYTIAIWIEGNDADTTDEKLGGQMKIDFKFSDSAIPPTIPGQPAK